MDDIAWFLICLALAGGWWAETRISAKWRALHQQAIDGWVSAIDLFRQVRKAEDDRRAAQQVQTRVFLGGKEITH